MFMTAGLMIRKPQAFEFPSSILLLLQIFHSNPYFIRTFQYFLKLFPSISPQSCPATLNPAIYCQYQGKQIYLLSADFLSYEKNCQNQAILSLSKQVNRNQIIQEDNLFALECTQKILNLRSIISGGNNKRKLKLNNINIKRESQCPNPSLPVQQVQIISEKKYIRFLNVLTLIFLFNKSASDICLKSLGSMCKECDNVGIIIKILISKQVQSKMMLSCYNLLRQTYIVDGFDEAEQYIEELESRNELPELVLINFYCYINIQAKFKDEATLEILNNCLDSPDCCESLRALTLYHIASLYFQRGDYNNCKSTCQQLVQQFIGLYYSMEMRLEKSPQQLTLAQQLQQLIYYVFLMLSYVSKEENNPNDSNVLYEAGRRIIKDRQDVLSLTTKTTILKTEESEEMKLYSPQVGHKKDSEKQNFSYKGFTIKHAKSTI